MEATCRPCQYGVRFPKPLGMTMFKPRCQYSYPMGLKDGDIISCAGVYYCLGNGFKNRFASVFSYLGAKAPAVKNVPCFVVGMIPDGGIIY